MPFNPSLPANNSPISSSELRDNFSGLKDYVDDVANDLNMNINDAVSNPPTQAANAASGGQAEPAHP